MVFAAAHANIRGDTSLKYADYSLALRRDILFADRRLIHARFVLAMTENERNNSYHCATLNLHKVAYVPHYYEDIIPNATRWQVG